VLRVEKEAAGADCDEGGTDQQRRVSCWQLGDMVFGSGVLELRCRRGCDTGEDGFLLFLGCMTVFDGAFGSIRSMD
jgi:hypothetical protein